MQDPRTLSVHDGRQLTAARALAGLTLRELAAAAQTTTRTINRLECGGPVLVSAKKRHGHVERDLWDRILMVLERHGVEFLADDGDRGGGVRWKQSRLERGTARGS
jgi:transcriptional regulator with XRE-family HTH domain